MFVSCCLPYLARKEVVISNKAKVIYPEKESLLCTLELRNKDSTIEDDYLDYQFYVKNTKIAENVGHCYLSRILSYKANVLIKIAPSAYVKITKVKLGLGWKYKLSQNEIRFKVTADDEPTTPSRPSNLDLVTWSEPCDLSGHDSIRRFSVSPVSQYSIPPSPADSMMSGLSFSEYEPPTQHDSASYYLIHPQASAKHSSVEVTSSNFNGVVEAGKAVHFKVVVKNEEGETLHKGTKYQLIVKLGGETIFSGSVSKRAFKIKRTHSGQFSPLFYINEDLIPGNHFYVHVVPSIPHSVKNLVFQVESPPNMLKQECCDILFDNLWTTCNADIVDRYGNKLVKSYDVEINGESFLEFSHVDLEEGRLHFRMKANKVGKTNVSIQLREEYSDTNIILKTDIDVKSPSMVH